MRLSLHCYFGVVVFFVQLCAFQLHGQELVVAQIGDSVAQNNRNRIAANQVFADDGIVTRWIGDHSSPATFARGGITYDGMLNGNSSLGHLGLIDIVDGIQTGTYDTPDALYLLGGYNNAFFEPVDSTMVNSLNDLNSILDLAQAELPDTDIFVSNVTLLTGPSEDRLSNVLTLNALIETEVANRNGIYLVDNYSIVNADDLRSDGLHLNDSTGQQKIGVNFANTVLAVPEPGSLTTVGFMLSLMLIRRQRMCSRSVNSPIHGLA